MYVCVSFRARSLAVSLMFRSSFVIATRSFDTSMSFYGFWNFWKSFKFAFCYLTMDTKREMFAQLWRSQTICILEPANALILLEIVRFQPLEKYRMCVRYPKFQSFFNSGPAALMLTSPDSMSFSHGRFFPKMLCSFTIFDSLFSLSFFPHGL